MDCESSDRLVHHAHRHHEDRCWRSDSFRHRWQSSPHRMYAAWANENRCDVGSQKKAQAGKLSDWKTRHNIILSHCCTASGCPASGCPASLLFCVIVVLRHCCSASLLFCVIVVLRHCCSASLLFCVIVVQRRVEQHRAQHGSR